jgi:hypothetical protein
MARQSQPLFVPLLGRTALEFQLGLALPFALGLFEEPSRPCSIAQRQRGAHQGNHWWQFIAEQLSNITAGMIWK